MRLVSAVLGFVLRKVGLLGALLLSLFVGYLLTQALVPDLREAVADRDRLRQVAEERAALEEDLGQLKRTAAEGQRTAIESLTVKIDAEIEEGRRDVTEKKADIKRLRDSQRTACRFLGVVIDQVAPGSPCKSAEWAVEKTDAALDTLERNLDRAKDDAAILDDPDLTPQQKLDRLRQGGDESVAREIDNKESELGQKRAEEQSLEEAQASGVGWVVDQWAQSWKWLAAIALLALLTPPALRSVSYFLLMPMVTRAHKPIHLAAGSENVTADLRATAAQRTLTIDLAAGEVLSARSEHVRPVQGGMIRSRLLYDWTSPFISFAAGLYGLSRITGDGRVTSTTLSTPDAPDSYLMRIDFHDHPGVVMHPKHVVGVIGMPTLKTRWRWGIQSFATWQVRYIMFAGSGSLIVQGSGDVVATNPRGGSTRMEQNLVMGFDSRLTVGVHRTEVFWPYLWRRTPLVDDDFTGAHPLFWQKSTTDGPSNPIAKTFDVFFSALGKLFGF